jgi:ribosome maturation factor RimP
LDAEDPLPGPYTLEVSSPGLERPFFSLEQIGPYAGDLMEVKLKEPWEGRKKWRGILLEAEGSRIRLEVEGRKVDLPWDRVEKIHRKYVPKQ